MGRIVCIDVGERNAGIICNISEGGLCFRTIAPAEPGRTVNFWVSGPGQRIGGQGRVVWTDETRKGGGLAFANLSVHARKQIYRLITDPTLPTEAAIRGDGNCNREATATGSVGVAPVSPQALQSKPFHGFLSGLVTGVLVALLLAGAFIYRRQIGRVHIVTREQLASRYPRLFLWTPRPSTRRHSAVPVVAQLSQTRQSSSQENLTPLALVNTESVLKPGDGPGIHAEASRSNNQIRNEPTQTYFEVGKFKEHSRATEERDKLAQLGYPAIIQARVRSSYEVLIGPYQESDEAERARKSLVWRGFQARTLERGYRYFVLPPRLILNGGHIPVGNCTITWESHGIAARVKFEHDNREVSTARGTWVKQDRKYERNAIIYIPNSDGSHKLVEVRFAGMTRALVFDN
jgi:hypothetical protein